MDIKHSLSYFRKQDGWLKSYFALVVWALLGVFPIIGHILVIIVEQGYMIALANHRIFKPQTPLMPWSISKIFKTGLKATIPTVILYGMVYSFLAGNANNPEALLKNLPMMGVLFIVLGTFCDLALLLLMTNLKIRSMFKFNGMKFILVNNFSEYVKFSMVRFFVTIAFVTIIVLSAITIVGPLFLAPSLIFIMADLNAQFLRKIFKINVESQG